MLSGLVSLAIFSSAYRNRDACQAAMLFVYILWVVGISFKISVEEVRAERAWFGGWVKYGSEFLGCELNLDEWLLGYALTSSWFHSELELKRCMVFRGVYGRA